MTATTQIWRFKALDTWFFRESRPMESVGGSELLSAFPPSPRTLSGAVRSVVGEHKQVNWQQWRDKTQYIDIKQLIGDSDSLGQLRFSGPWLARETADGQTERLFPAPQNLVAAMRQGDENTVDKVKRLLVGLPRYCDLGKQVRMATTQEGYGRLRSLEDFWLSAKALETVLAGGECQSGELVSTRQLFGREARLGIARSNMSRTVETGLLYQTRHVRPHQNVVIETDVVGLAVDDHPAEGIIRLGGEGRGAAYSTKPVTATPILKKTQAGNDTHGVMLMLLTPACMETSSEFIPLPGFCLDDTGGSTVWKGVLHEVNLTLHCAIQGKPVREGGWDLANNKPRPVQSLVPAGSVYYLTVDNGDIQAAIDALHLTQLPANESDLALGRGLLAVGLWPANELMNKE